MELTITLDGVPYKIIKELQEEGYFSQFAKAKKIIAAFPTITIPCLNAYWHTRYPPGYESVDFCKEKNKFLTNNPVAYGVGFKDNSFVGEYDYFSSELTEMIRYLGSRLQPDENLNLDIEKELAAFEKQFLKSENQKFRAWLIAYDECGHRLGMKAVKEKLKRFDTFLKQLHTKKQFTATIFSDHGNSDTAANFLDLEQILKDAGYKKATSLKKDENFVLPARGALTFARIYTKENNIKDISLLLAKKEEIDFVAYRKKDNKIIVAKGDQTARILKEGKHFCYSPISGDPLNYLERIPPDKFIHQTPLLVKTHDAPNPDGLFRMYAAFNWIKHPADILISLNQNWLFGSKLAYNVGRCKAMHGNMTSDNSEAFLLIQEDVSLPLVIRASDVAAHIEF